jgi:type IV pilus assembly protein PilE
MSTQSSKHASSGFTLIELMVTVAIVTILATLAVTSYTSQVRKSRRTEAKSALLDLAGREERLFSTTNTYSQDEVFLGYATVSTQMTNMTFGNRYYTLTAVVPDPAQAPPPPAGIPSYILKATPVAGNSQAGDTTCGAFSVNQLGVQTVTGTGTAASCWGD